MSLRPRRKFTPLQIRERRQCVAIAAGGILLLAVLWVGMMLPTILPWTGKLAASL